MTTDIRQRSRRRQHLAAACGNFNYSHFAHNTFFDSKMHEGFIGNRLFIGPELVSARRHFREYRHIRTGQFFAFLMR